MGILVEFNPELTLRNILEFKEGNKEQDECIPKNLVEGEIYEFLKKGQRNYWMFGEIDLIETKGEEILSSPKAKVILLEATHFLINQEIYTKGKYKVIKIL